MSASISPVLSDVYTALRSFILAQLPGVTGTQVIQGYQNRVAMPTPPGSGFVVMTAFNMKRLRTNVHTTPPGGNPTTTSAEQGTQVDIQLDLYGPQAADWANILSTLLRDEVGCAALAPNCQPLYADDPVRAPLESAETQYEDRWLLTARIQMNPVTVTSQQYADTLGPVGIIDVEVSYPI